MLAVYDIAREMERLDPRIATICDESGRWERAEGKGHTVLSALITLLS
jgi:hypothetical protein